MKSLFMMLILVIQLASSLCANSVNGGATSKTSTKTSNVVRRNLSVSDIITGFQARELFYFEMVLDKGKYMKAFNKCLSSIPADPAWIQQHCKKNVEFKNSFECSEGDFTNIWFVYESLEQCEEVRGPMKEKMDALRE